jgi:hypothetical protein
MPQPINRPKNTVIRTDQKIKWYFSGRLIVPANRLRTVYHYVNPFSGLTFP